MKYLADPYNYVDVTSSLLIICVLPLRLSDCDAQWGVFAVGYIIWTIRSIKFLTVFRQVFMSLLLFNVLTLNEYTVVQEKYSIPNIQNYIQNKLSLN